MTTPRVGRCPCGAALSLISESETGRDFVCEGLATHGWTLVTGWGFDGTPKWQRNQVLAAVHERARWVA